VNTLYFIWSKARAAYLAFSQHSDKAEHKDIDNYLSQARNFADLEYLQRHWMQSH
jgi:hypothetical protein